MQSSVALTKKATPMLETNSPFTSLASHLYSPTLTQSAGNQQVSDLVARTNPYLVNKAQPLNRGRSRGMWPSFQQQGTAQAAMRAAPLQQQMGDQLANAQFDLQKSQANEGFNQQMLSNTLRNINMNNDPSLQLAQYQYGKAMTPMAGQFMQQMTGTNPLANLFSMFGG